MTSERKNYLIQIFLKKCTLQSRSKEHLDFKFKWCENTFPKVSPEKIEELKNKYTLNEYIKEITPVIDKFFTIEELKTLIQFYSSNVGKKMLNPQILKAIEKAAETLDYRLEQEFRLNQT